MTTIELRTAISADLDMQLTPRVLRFMRGNPWHDALRIFNLGDLGKAATVTLGSVTHYGDDGGIVGYASKRCDAATVTLGSVTHYGAVTR